VSDRSGEWQQQALCGWRDKHDVETADDACRTGKAMLGALMERKAQRGTNRACSGMVATVALPHTVQGLRRWAEHLDGVWDGDAEMMTGLSQKIKGYKKITTDVK